MEIIPPRNFRDARDIPAKFTKYDPRLPSFPSPDIILNLTECASVQPPATLWCAIYLSLCKQSGLDCSLLPPNDLSAMASLTDAGLFRLLREGNVNVQSDDTAIPASPDTILPLTRFDGLREAAELTNRVEAALYDSGLGSANIHPIVCELFSELVNNAAEHSESGIGAYAFIQFCSSGQGRKFMCGVADGGIGIRQSIERNPAVAHFGYDWAAIDIAVKELVSGTSSRTRGIGLFSVFSEMRVPGRELVIHSGNGILTLTSDSQIRMVRANPFPGALVYFSVPA